jgi:hypothetical protein
MPKITSEEYRGHATPAEFTLKPVLVSQIDAEVLAACHSGQPRRYAHQAYRLIVGVV